MPETATPAMREDIASTVHSILAGGFRHDLEELFSTSIPNLKQVGLQPERPRPHEAALGLLEYEHLPASA